MSEQTIEYEWTGGRKPKDLDKPAHLCGGKARKCLAEIKEKE
jgi:hypothetical protein